MPPTSTHINLRTAQVTAGRVEVGSCTAPTRAGLYDNARLLVRLAIAAFGRAELYLDGDLISAARETVPGPLPVMLQAATA